MTEAVLVCANHPGRETGLLLRAGSGLLWPLAYAALMIGSLFYRLRGIRI